MKQTKRLIGLLMAVVMLLSMVPVSFAAKTAGFPDFPTGWSKEAMTAAVNNGLLNGFEDGKIHPEANLTRAQFAAIMVRAFAAKTKADISNFKDVRKGTWYYDDIAKAVKMGALNGQSERTMAPNSPITRQEVFTAFARILVLSDDNTTALNKFNDKGRIASWAINHMAALTQRGYVNGDPQGNANPEALITREEFAQLMHNAIRTYITKPGEYTGEFEGIVVVRVGDVTLKGFKNTSDLVIGDGAGEGNIRLEDVAIEKRFLTRGGNIKVVKSELGDFVVVNNVNGVTKFQNYRDEQFFKGIVENTEAQFLKRPSGSVSPSVPDEVHNVTLKVDGKVYDNITIVDGVVSGYLGDPTKDYYKFDGWYDDLDNKVTNLGSLTDGQEIHAKFTPNLYTVNFAGTPAFTWADGFVPVTQFTDETGFDLPSKDKVVAPLGHTFEYWKLNGVKVDSLEAIKESGYLPKTESATITIEAHFVLKQYKVVYEGVVWDSDYTPVLEYNILTVDRYKLPTESDIIVPQGMKFFYWTKKGTVTPIGKLTITESTPDVLTLVPHFEPIGTPDKVYTITLKNEDGTVYDTVVVTNAIPDKTVKDPTKDYYTFDGWFDSLGNKVVDFGSVDSDEELTAKFTAIKYNVSFKPDDIEWVTGFTPISDFTVEELTTKELPSSDKVVVPLGYIFECFKVNGNRVDSLTDVKAYLPKDSSATITIEAHFVLKEYKVVYENVTWKTGYTPVLTYDITTVDRYKLPTESDIIVPQGMKFFYWTKKGTVTPIGKLTITESTPDVLTLVPHFEPIGTPDKVYTITLKNEDGTVYDTVVVTNAIPDKTVKDPQKDYYTFDGWFDSLGNKVVDFGSVDSDEVLTAKFTAIVYTLSYVSGVSYIPVDFVPGYTPQTSFTVETGITLPDPAKVDLEYYRVCYGWAYKDISVTSLEDILNLGINKTASEVVKIQAVISVRRYYIEYENVTFVDGYTPLKSYTINSIENDKLPTAETIANVPAGMEFKYWKDENGNKVTALTVIENTPDVLKLFPHYEPISVTPDVYTLTLKVDGSVYDTVVVTNGVPDKTVADPTKDYYTFDGWFDSSDNKVTDFGTVTATQELNAKFTAISYNVVFTGTPSLEWVTGFTPIADFTVEELTTKELPAKDNVVAPVGYEFEYWKLDGNRVDSLTAIKDGGYLPVDKTATITIEAHYVLKQYQVVYKNVEWKAGYTPVTEYNLVTAGSYTLPSADNIVAPGGQFFKYWTNENGERVDTLSITATTPDVITLVPYFEAIPAEPVTVKFYNRFSTVRVIGEVTVENGATVAKSDFPAIKDAWLREGYTEDANIAEIYDGNEYTHKIVPEFWYLKDGVLTPFDETVKVYENTSVYLLSRALSLMLTYDLDGETQVISVSADYNEDTRIMNSIKDIVAKSGRQQLELALATGMIPNYDEMVGKIFDKMASTGIIELDGNEKKIQNVKVPLKISTFVKEDVAYGMVKTYLRDVVKNPAELDKIFTMIDVSEFASQMGIDTIIQNMSDAEIASLMKSSDNKTDIIDFVYSDLQKEDSVMIDFVIDYVTTDVDFRNDLINQIIADLKDSTKTTTLKTKALNYITEQLKPDNNGNYSAFHAKFVSMVKADLTSENSAVMNAVVSYIRTNLKADTQEGKNLRKEFLTNTDLLKQFFQDKDMKAEIIELILQDAFIDKALDNVDFRTVLVEAIMDDDDFIDLLLASKEFHDYIIDQLHPVDGDPSAHPLAKDVEDLIQAEDSEFRAYVLDLVKASTAFTGLFATHPELKDVVLDEFAWSHFVASDDDFLRYAFRQSGVAGTYTFVSLDDIDAKIAEKYNALSDIEKYALTESTNNWNDLSATAKQKVRDELFNHDEAKAEVIAEAKSKFDSYKTDIVNKITQGKFSEITDETALKLVDDLLVGYVTKYIEQEELNADATINASIAGVIEEILFGFISDLIHGVHFDPELEEELATMLGHIDSIKHQFVIDPTPDVIARLKEVVKNYRDTHVDNINKIVDTNYETLTNKLISMIDPDAANSVYSDVESVLVSVADTVNADLIKKYVKDIDAADKANGTTKLEDLIKQYLPKITAKDLNNYIAAFLYDSVNDKENTANVATVRTEIESFITDANQADAVKEMAVTYITDSDNADEIKVAISDFIDDIDETFVNTNRSVIEEAIKSIDVTEFVDEQFIKDYVNGLDESKGEKTAFADQIYDTLQNNSDFKTFMNQLLKGDAIVVNKSNLSFVTAISGAIKGLGFNSVINFIDNAAITKLMDAVGSDFVKTYYDEMIKEYCDGLDAVINEVKTSSDDSIKKSYTTSLTFKLNVFTIYDKLYEKAIEKAVDKLENLDLYYNENIYLKFLVEHDILEYILNGDLSQADGDFSGYSLKTEMDYYDYLVMLLLVGDDALTWYGDEVDGLSDEQLDALYNAAFDKIFFVHEKANEILEAFAKEGELPAKIQSAVQSVSQLNSLVLKYGETGKSLINRYLDSNINIKFSSIDENEKVLKLVDFIVGNDDPVINIDSVYAMLFTFNDKIQSKLEAVVETDKFKAAVEKFESSGFGGMFDGKGKLGTIGDKLDELAQKGRIESALDSLYDMFYLLAYEGIDAFKVPNEGVKDREIYRISVGKVTMEVRREYR